MNDEQTRAGGYVMVPREPTEAMLRDARAATEVMDVRAVSVEEYVSSAWSAMLTAAPPPIVSAPGEREPYSGADDDLHRAFIDGWNARLDHADFDLALHYWMLAGVTHIGSVQIAPASERGAVERGIVSRLKAHAADLRREEWDEDNAAAADIEHAADALASPSIEAAALERARLKTAICAARYAWVCSHGVKGQGVDDAIVDAVIASLKPSNNGSAE